MVSNSPFEFEHEQSATDHQESKPTRIQPDLDFLYPDYYILSELGEGGFGAVYEVIDNNHRTLAMKVQKETENGPSDLQKEFNIYRALLQHNESGANTTGIPAVKEYKEHKGLEYLFMERLGDSLHEIKFKSPGKKLSKSDVLMVGIQCVRRLRTLHQNNILHRDIKPSNLVMGIGPQNEKTVHIIDFGISSIVENWETYSYDDEVRFCGTLHYAPTEALFKKAPSRKGDLMSLAYTLLSLASNDLPWVYVNTQRERLLTEIELGVQRIRWKPEDLCEEFPELIYFFKTISRTKPACEPQYDRLIELLEAALEEIGSQNDGNFSWLQNAPRTIESPSLCTDCSQNADEESSKSFFGSIQDGAERLQPQSIPEINALPWPPPPQRVIHTELFAYSAHHAEPEVFSRPCLVPKETKAPLVQCRPLIEDFQRPPRQILSFKDYAISDDRIIVPLESKGEASCESASPGTESENRESTSGIVSLPCDSPDSTSTLDIQPKACRDCNWSRNRGSSNGDSSRSQRKTEEEMENSPKDERLSETESSKMLFLILCILIDWDNIKRRERASSDKSLKNRDGSGAYEVTPSSEFQMRSAADTAKQDSYRLSDAEARPEKYDEVNKTLMREKPEDAIAEDYGCESILDAAAHLYCADNHECDKTSLVEGEANDREGKKKDRSKKGQKRALFKQVWLKGFGVAVRLISRPAAALARKRCRH